MTETRDPRAVPASLDAPFPTPGSADPPSPGTGYMPERELPAQTLFSCDQRSTGGASVLLMTVHVGGESRGAPYTMFETHEHRKPIVTIARGPDVLARLEPHNILFSVLSIWGGPPVRLRDWLHCHAQKTGRNSFLVGDTRYEWRRTARGFPTELELYAPGSHEPIAFSRHGNVVPTAMDELPASDSSLAAARNSQRKTYAILFLHAGAPAEDSLHIASLWLSLAAVYLQDMVVVSYLLLERETMGTLSA